MRGFWPWARQVPKRELRVILASVPWFERVPPLILAADHQGAQAALGGVVVRGHFRLGHEDEEFLEVLVNAPAQLALDRQRVVQAGTAEGQQPFFQGQLGDAPLFPRRVTEGRSLAVVPMHGVGPLGQLL